MPGVMKTMNGKLRFLDQKVGVGVCVWKHELKPLVKNVEEHSTSTGQAYHSSSVSPSILVREMRKASF